MTNNAHFANISETIESEKDLWETPRCLFNTLSKEFNFDLDVCASKDNALCHYYFSEEQSALENEWFANNAFMNPPFSQVELFLKRAEQQAKEKGITVVALVNANTDVSWFANAVKSANEIRLITGRIGFVKPSGQAVNGNPKGQALIIWRGKCNTPCNITMINRSGLMSDA